MVTWWTTYTTWPKVCTYTIQVNWIWVFFFLVWPQCLSSDEANVNAEASNDILDNSVLHHTALVHKASSIKKWLFLFAVEELDWDAQSPDLNTMQPLWDEPEHQLGLNIQRQCWTSLRLQWLTGSRPLLPGSSAVFGCPHTHYPILKLWGPARANGDALIFFYNSFNLDWVTLYTVANTWTHLQPVTFRISIRSLWCVISGQAWWVEENILTPLSLNPNPFCLVWANSMVMRWWQMLACLYNPHKPPRTHVETPPSAWWRQRDADYIHESKLIYKYCF